VTLHGRLFRWLGHRRWFAAMGRRTAWLDRMIYRASGGRLSTAGVPIQPTLLLTTTGRRTGRERTTPVMYLREGSCFVVSSENFGQRRPAAWPLNLEAEPRARIQVGKETIPCRARRATREEVSRYWPRLVEEWPAHETYLRRSGVRHMFVLEPAV
jgi:deazaflavin-dependent oxidoreductase (nitroreductase family)